MSAHNSNMAANMRQVLIILVSLGKDQTRDMLWEQSQVNKDEESPEGSPFKKPETAHLAEVPFESVNCFDAHVW